MRARWTHHAKRSLARTCGADEQHEQQQQHVRGLKLGKPAWLGARVHGLSWRFVQAIAKLYAIIIDIFKVQSYANRADSERKWVERCFPVGQEEEGGGIISS